MTAATGPRKVGMMAAMPRQWPTAPLTAIKEGWLVGRYATGANQGTVAPIGTDPGLVCEGVARNAVDNTASATAGSDVYADELVYPLYSTGLDETAEGQPAYGADNQTFSLSSSAGPLIGVVWLVTSSTYAYVKVGREGIALAQSLLAVAGASTAFRPRAVVTSLAAYTASGGVLTGAVNGALGTQDGVSTLAVNDVVFIQAGTTNLAAASDAGPYQIVALGGGGAKYVLQRPSWWAHGAPIVQASDIRIGGEGTLWAGTVWRSFVATGKVVGTDDPALYPGTVTQAVTLVSGHIAVTNVPIRSVTQSNFIIRRKTAATPTLTLEYVPLSIAAGPLGTASVDVTAAVAAGTINTADGSTLLLSVVNF